MPSPSRAAIIDEFGELDRRVAELKPVIDRHKELKQTICGWCDKIEADKGAVFEGRRYSAHVAAAKITRKITDKLRAFNLLKKVLGLRGAVEKVTIPLEKAVDAYIPEKQHKLFLVEVPGSREVHAVAKAAEVTTRAA